MITKLICILAISLLSILTYGQETKGKSKVGLSASVILANNFTYYDHELQKVHNRSGCGGFGASIFYRTNNKNKFSFYHGVAVDNRELPVERFDGTVKHNMSFFFDLLYHRKIYRGIHGIAGVNFTNYKFSLVSYEESIPGYGLNEETFGLTTGIECNVFKGFGIALFYRPALISFDRNQYLHIISLEVRYSLNLPKK